MREPVDLDTEVLCAALLTLTDFGIPPDVQELLVNGDPQRGIRRGALSAAFKAALLVTPVAKERE